MIKGIVPTKNISKLEYNILLLILRGNLVKNDKRHCSNKEYFKT